MKVSTVRGHLICSLNVFLDTPLGRFIKISYHLFFFIVPALMIIKFSNYFPGWVQMLLSWSIFFPGRIKLAASVVVIDLMLILVVLIIYYVTNYVILALISWVWKGDIDYINRKQYQKRFHPNHVQLNWRLF